MDRLSSFFFLGVPLWSRVLSRMSFVIWSRFFRSTLFVLRLRGRRDICRWRLRSSFILYEFGLVCLFHPTWSFELLHQTDAFRCFVSVWRMSFTPCVTSTAPLSFACVAPVETKKKIPIKSMCSVLNECQKQTQQNPINRMTNTTTP